MIALIWNCPVPLVEITVRYELFVQGMRELGEECITVCPTGAELGYGLATRTFDDTAELSQAGFWKSLGCRIGIIITWHRMTNVLIAMREAGMKSIALTDSDGQCSPRFHPWQTYQFMALRSTNWLIRIRASKHWLRRYLFDADGEHRELARNVLASTATVMPSPGGVDAICQLLRQTAAPPEAASRIAFLPYPVAGKVIARTVNTHRNTSLVAVGRWNAVQKNTPLLVRTIQRLWNLGVRPTTLIIGEATDSLENLVKRCSNVRLIGRVSHDQACETMADSKILLSTSRWEGSPVSANEMLAMGGTLVGTPIPSFQSLVHGTRFGTIAARSSCVELARAVRTELAAWDSGQRDPLTNADHWRRLVSPVAVARRFLDLAESIDPRT